jgi:NADH-quinone oxidoreductase subunit C
VPGSRSLSPAEIGDRVRARFGDDISSVEDAHGHTVVTVSAARWVDLATFLRDEPDLAFDYFDFLTAVDRIPQGGGFEVVTHVFSTRHNQHCRMKAELSADDPSVATLSGVWPGANWCERETWDLFGVVFEGHPHLVKLVLSEQFEGHPLRKSFALMTREAKPWPGAVEGEEVED